MKNGEYIEIGDENVCKKKGVIICKKKWGSMSGAAARTGKFSKR